MELKSTLINAAALTVLMAAGAGFAAEANAAICAGDKKPNQSTAIFNSIVVPALVRFEVGTDWRYDKKTILAVNGFLTLVNIADQDRPKDEKAAFVFLFKQLVLSNATFFAPEIYSVVSRIWPAKKQTSEEETVLAKTGTDVNELLKKTPGASKK